MEEKKKEAGESRRKLQKLLHSNAPGIDLFLPDEKGENGFRLAVVHLDFELKQCAGSSVWKVST